jgi:hypothetical protein
MGICCSAAALLTIAAGSATVRLAVQDDYDKVLCYEQFQSARPDITLPNEPPFRLVRAMNLFRFHRRQEALAIIDAALKTVAGPFRHRIPPDERKEIATDLLAFRTCVATRRMPDLATLTVHVWRQEFEDSSPEGRKAPAAGATVLVEGIPAGTTADDGTLTMQVPSGDIHLTAQVPRTHWGEEYISLAAGAYGTVSIGLHDGKEVTEETELVLVEAVDDIIPAWSPSFTLKFVRDGEWVPIVDIERIELLDRHGDLSDHDIEKLFAISAGAIATTDTAPVFASMMGQLDETITVRVHAIDAAGLGHADEVRFRVGQSRLIVTLAAPPSLPALRISGVEVGVSIMGAGIAVQRVSDDTGRFEIESFPHGPVAFHAEVKQDGRYYYGDATMAHFGQRSVALVLRHVSDLVNGVPALELGPPTAERPPAPRRTGGAARER